MKYNIKKKIIIIVGLFVVLYWTILRPSGNLYSFVYEKFNSDKKIKISGTYLESINKKNIIYNNQPIEVEIYKTKNMLISVIPDIAKELKNNKNIQYVIDSKPSARMGIIYYIKKNNIKGIVLGVSDLKQTYILKGEFQKLPNVFNPYKNQNKDMPGLDFEDIPKFPGAVRIFSYNILEDNTVLNGYSVKKKYIEVKDGMGSLMKNNGWQKLQVPSRKNNTLELISSLASFWNKENKEAFVNIQPLNNNETYILIIYKIK